MKNKIIGILTVFTAVILMLTVNSYAESGVINKVYDPANKTVILNSSFDVGPEHDVFLVVTDEAGNVKYKDAVKTVYGGKYTVDFGVEGFAEGSYTAKLKCEEFSNETEFVLPIQNAKQIPISLECANPYILTDGTELDSDFSAVNLVSDNTVFTDRKYISDKDYTVRGLPEGITAQITAADEKTLRCKFEGNMKNALSDECEVVLKVKSTVITGGSANTDSEEFKIDFCSEEFSKRVNVFGDYTISFGMKNEVQVDESKKNSELDIAVRKLAVDGVLDKSCYSYSGLPKGLSLKVYADSKNNKVQISLEGSATNKITQDVTISDFKLMSSLCKGSSLDSLPIKINITAKKGSSESGGGPSGSSGNSSSNSNKSSIDVPSVYPNPEKVTFPDITGHWAKESIEQLASQGYVNGFPDKNFHPDDNITRAEYVAIIVRTAGLNTVSYKDSFSDIAKEQWYAAYVQTALENNIISQDDTFRPDALITREEMTKMLIGAYQTKKELPKTEIDIKSFADYEKISDWARSYVINAASMGMINGYPDNTFRPSGNATRAEAATVLCKLYGVLK